MGDSDIMKLAGSLYDKVVFVEWGSVVVVPGLGHVARHGLLWWDSGNRYAVIATA